MVEGIVRGIAQSLPGIIATHDANVRGKGPSMRPMVLQDGQIVYTDPDQPPYSSAHMHGAVQESPGVLIDLTADTYNIIVYEFVQCSLL